MEFIFILALLCDAVRVQVLKKKWKDFPNGNPRRRAVLEFVSN